LPPLNSQSTQSICHLLTSELARFSPQSYTKNLIFDVISREKALFYVFLNRKRGAERKSSPIAAV